ncbi:MAG TPA: MFS transporter [Caulobacteraceae bacterium]|jgi:predicted MFS family arabinose efflux permease
MALEGLAFFMADMQAGIGPFLGVFLLAHGWRAGPIGSAMSVGAVAGMLAVGPCGALVDATTHKRSWIAMAGLLSLSASGIVLVSQQFWVIGASQVIACIAGAALGPGMVGLTLGVARQEGFNAQNGRNQAFNHAGNMAGAALSGLAGWAFGFTAVFWLAAVFSALSIGCAFAIPRHAIDHAEARGLADAPGVSHRPRGWASLFESKPLLVAGAALMLFYLGDAAMLPLYGMAVVAAHRGDPAGFVAETIVVAQGVMVVTSLVAMKLAQRHGYWLVLLIAFGLLPVRGLIAYFVIAPWGVWPVEGLDGVASGLLSVAAPGLIARIMDGTGRINAAQGAIMAAQGFGGAVSPALGGWIAEAFGYPTALLSLGSVALVSLALWIGFARTLRPASQAVATPAPAAAG